MALSTASAKRVGLELMIFNVPIHHNQSHAPHHRHPRDDCLDAQKNCVLPVFVRDDKVDLSASRLRAPPPVSRDVTARLNEFDQAITYLVCLPRNVLNVVLPPVAAQNG